MPFIGNTPQTQSFAPAIDYFSGNGVTVTFTLSRPVVSVAQLTVAVDNVIQNPSSAFTVSGNSITFTSAPLSGTNNIWVEYTSLITTYAAISQDPSVIGDITATGGFLAEGDFGNSYIDGTIVDYVTGNARITTGPIDDMTFYHGGTSGRSEMMKLSYAGNSYIVGNLGISTTSPQNTLEVYNGSNTQIRVRNGALNTQSYDFGRNGSTGLLNFYGNQTGFTGYVFGGVDGTRMTIDSAGRVTTPFQPYIIAARTGSGFTTDGSNPIQFNTILNQVGITASNSNSRFTVPVAGTYLICFNWFLTNPSNLDNAMTVLVNGTEIYRFGANSNGLSGTPSNYGDGAAQMYYFNANDYVDFRGSGAKTVLGANPYHTTVSIGKIY